MTFEIERGGRSRTVSIERAGANRYRFAVDGHPHLVDAVKLGEFSLSLIVDGETGSSRELLVVPTSGTGELLVTLDGLTATVSVDGRRTRRPGADAGGQVAGVQKVTAPMPGRVVRVLVGPGDEIAVRQPVVVVEAMKMENELRSPKAGRVKEVPVSAGMSVEAGRTLVVIE
jgi:biotin carboxyl carrier protein